MGTSIVVGRIGFNTAAQLIVAINELASGLSLDDLYVKDNEGNEFGVVCLEQETLSDGSVAFNLILDYEGDPNS